MVSGQPADLKARDLLVAVDAGPLLDPPTGVGRYTRELIDNLRLLGCTVSPYAVTWRASGQGPGDLKRWRVPARLARALWRGIGGPSIDRLVGDVEIVHATNFVLPTVSRAAAVVTVHDLSFLRDDVFPGGSALRSLVPWSVTRADRIVVPTRAVAEELGDRFGLDGDRIVVTAEGVSQLFFGATPLADTVLGHMGIPGPFILATGTIEPRKNLAMLLRAWERARPSLPGWTLVVAGPRGWGPELPRTDGVVLTGWVGDETLPGLYAAADLFCFPSLYEGFGLPPLEAMAAGTACVAATYSAAAETLGDAARLLDPHDDAAWTDALVDLCRDPSSRQRLAITGRARAAAFRWEDTAAATITAYRAALAG